MWLMKTLLTSRCINQRGAGQTDSEHLLINAKNRQERAYLILQISVVDLY